MPLPTSYTESTLAIYMQDTLKEIAVDLGWLDTTPITGDYVRPVENVAAALGVSDVEDSTDDPQLIRLQADVAIWTEALGAYVRAYAAGGIANNLQRQQLFDHARVMLQNANAALAAYNGQVQRNVVGEPVPLYSSSVPIKIIW